MDFAKWSKAELVNYLEFLIHSYRVMDAFWFLNIESTYDLNEACRINELVWGKVAQLGARDLKKRFGLNQGGLAGLVEALKLWPWSILVDYRYIEKPGEVLVEIDSCPPQAARLKRGLGEYPCQAMHMAEFIYFAREIDPRIKVECLFAPPDEHPPDLFCRWRFTLKDSPAEK